jgi:hypothetical protein
VTVPARRPAGRTAVALLVAAVVVTGLLLVAPGSGASAPLPSEREWRADVRHAMAGGRAYLTRRADRGGRRLAVNLDIDNTALATRYDAGEPTPPVLRFARRAERLGMRVFFNTARHRGDGNLHRVAERLRAVGYAVDRVCGRRHGEEIVESKQRCRRQFRDRGYTLVANVGNRRTDFVGGGYERRYKLPSYGGRLS